MYSIFQTEIVVRPDDIDMNNHVHNSKYLDYVMAARYDQMIKDYKMSMSEFYKLGYNWVVSSVFIDYKRALVPGDVAVVKTQLDSIYGAQCKVNFRIEIKRSGKIAAQGNFLYTMISIDTGKPVRIPQEIIEKYAI